MSELEPDTGTHVAVVTITAEAEVTHPTASVDD